MKYFTSFFLLIFAAFIFASPTFAYTGSFLPSGTTMSTSVNFTDADLASPTYLSWGYTVTHNDSGVILDSNNCFVMGPTVPKNNVDTITGLDFTGLYTVKVTKYTDDFCTAGGPDVVVFTQDFTYPASVVGYAGFVNSIQLMGESIIPGITPFIPIAGGLLVAIGVTLFVIKIFKALLGGSIKSF